MTLKYTDERRPVISGMQRVSRPGQRTYVDHAHIPRIQGGMGTAIISTSKGVMTGHEARQQGVGAIVQYGRRFSIQRFLLPPSRVTLSDEAR